MTRHKKWAVSVQLTHTGEWNRVGEGSSNLQSQVKNAAGLLEFHAKIGSYISVRLIQVEVDQIDLQPFGRE